MNQLSQVTQQNASCSEELAATAEEMSSQAEQLQLAMEFFTLEAHTKEGKAATSHLHPNTRGRFMNESTANSRERAATVQRPIGDGDFVRFSVTGEALPLPSPTPQVEGLFFVSNPAA